MVAVILRGFSKWQMTNDKCRLFRIYHQLSFEAFGDVSASNAPSKDYWQRRAIFTENKLEKIGKKASIFESISVSAKPQLAWFQGLNDNISELLVGMFTSWKKYDKILLISTTEL